MPPEATSAAIPATAGSAPVTAAGVDLVARSGGRRGRVPSVKSSRSRVSSSGPTADPIAEPSPPLADAEGATKEGPPELDQEAPVSLGLGKTRKLDWGFIPIPQRRRHRAGLSIQECFPWTTRLNLVFALCSTVSVANLYYNQPMLVIIARDFNVSNDHVAQISALVQAGYACGIVFISPLGDLVRRRQLLMLLMFLGAVFSVACALATSVEMLVGFSFIVGAVTVTPQMMIPWSADLAPANIRARAMSTTLAGLVLGLVLGRVMAGVVSYYSSWRVVYWVAVGLQSAALLLEWLMLPDTPDKALGISYFQMLWSMVTYFFKYPTLTQACACFIFNSAVFAGYWTTQTFLLTNTFQFNSLHIGLMGLLGLTSACLAPVWGRLVDRVVPWLGQLIGLCISCSGMLIALFSAERSVVAIAISVTMFDTGNQLFQVSSSYRVAGLDPRARARLNGCVLLCVFAGQTSGTAVLTRIYNAHGWTPTGRTALGMMGVSLAILCARGPHEWGWVGWRGGARLGKRAKMLDTSPDAVTEGKREEKGAVRLSHGTSGTGPHEGELPACTGEDAGAADDVELGRTRTGGAR